MNHLTYLRTFLDTYRTGSLTRAARQLAITQPSASAHIAALEAMIGKPLFLRQARGVIPTPIADDLARSIAQEFDVIEAAFGAAQARSAQVTGTVHLVGPGEYLAARIAPMLAPLIAEGLRLRIQIGNRERIYAALAEHHAELAITASHPDKPDLGFAELAREQLLLVAAPDYAQRARGRAVTADWLAGQPCVAYDDTPALIGRFGAHVFGALPALQPMVIAPDLRILLAMVMAGAGWTVLPDYLCQAALARGDLVCLPTDKAGPENSLNLVWSKTALRHPRVLRVRDYLLAQHRGKG